MILAFRSSSRFPRLNWDRKCSQTIRDSGSTWRNRSFAECGMIRYTIEEAKAAFEDMLEHLKAGEPVEVIQGDQIVRLHTLPSRLGCMQGTGKIMGDLVAPLDEPWEALS